jgi:hypothetical protein
LGNIDKNGVGNGYNFASGVRCPETMLLFSNMKTRWHKICIHHFIKFIFGGNVMQAKVPASLLSVAVLLIGVIDAHALVMDFGTGSSTTTPSTPFSQAGLTMTPLDTGSVSGNHYDHYANAPFGTPSDNAAVIHTGNNGEEVSFVFMGGAAFDLLSIYVEGFLLDSDGDNGMNGLTATFSASSGATHTVSDPFSGIVDFTALSGWNNITSFTIGVPLGQGSCGIAGTDCSNFGFDDIVFQAHVSVPEPVTLALFSLGLAGLGLAARRRRAA